MVMKGFSGGVDLLERIRALGKGPERREANLKNFFGNLRDAMLGLAEQPRGVLSDLQIFKALATGEVVIDPYVKRKLNTASYDITLGEWFYLCEADSFEADFNPWDPDDVEQYYKGPFRAMTNQAWCDQHRKGRLWNNIPADAQIIVLRPGECILGHTIEFIGARRNAVPMMHARSSIGRVNISTCDDAGWGDIGYINRWTMEIRNKNKANVPLVVGERVGQIIFFAAGPTDRDYGLEGNYQGSIELDDLQANWKPEDMLPRLSLDYKEQ